MNVKGIGYLGSMKELSQESVDTIFKNKLVGQEVRGDSWLC